ncbi:tissue factor [Protopterus annectens]|uniref:tissue factor n=1 Tax=Protopterus annectens TaxID=7888 RepID=UPI001CF97C38|nr:tissue factor [Protopterus annectens]
MDLYVVVVLTLCSLISEKRWVVSSTKLPTADNLTWSSINLKTILEWQPAPTGFTYTVEISGKLTNWKKNPACIKTKNTECDLTRFLQDVKDTFYAHVISEPEGTNEEAEEYPYKVSPAFTPYNQTIIGQPDFTLKENEAKTKVKVMIKDPDTPYRYDNKTFRSIREFFNGNLAYHIYYWKATSTGKKTENTNTNEVEINIEKGESYCFSVQPVIPSRKDQTRLGHVTPPKCTPSQGSFLADYGPALLIIVIIAVVLSIIITVSICVACKCKKSAEEKKTENMPLKDV